MSTGVIELDARRLLCPMPVIRLQNCIKQQAAGARVQITCTDPGVMNDIPAWCRINGHSIISSHEQQDEYIILVEKSADEC
ncbi:MAG: sulfurtransferase TusA family protein [Proteobacteria bacterium]|nr:sulfurtransferase TusA family protein [Pseudomonadota bacterium]MCH8176916.1 sulfurtransferase TusA family protein [Pseudomonadota bacterium]